MKHNRNTYREWERERERQRRRAELLVTIIVVGIFVCSMLALAAFDTAPAFSELSR